MAGYNTTFVSPVEERHICKICTFVLCSPVQTICGHLFCKRCITAVITSGSKMCPEDHTVLSLDHIFSDAFCNREILELQCFCSRKDSGCNWTGPLKDIKKHHEECPKFLLKCPEGCQVTMPRSEMAMHLRQGCSFANANCPMTGQCDFQGSREEVQEHLEAKLLEHASMVKDVQSSLESDIKMVQISTTQIQEQQQVLVGTVNNLREELGTFREDLAILRVKVDHYETEGGPPLSVGETTGGKSDASELEEIKARLAKLEDQMKQLQVRERQKLTTQNAPATHGGTNEAVADFEKRLAALEHQHTLSDVQLAGHDVKISMLETTSYDGDYLWKIDDFGQRLQDAISGRRPYIHSPHFYLGCYGYKVCARMYLNGDGMGSVLHLSFFLVVMPGEYDAILPWPLERQVTFKLIDQRQQNHIIETIRPRLERPAKNTEIIGLPPFVAISERTSGGYIKEDVMFVKITVD